KPRDGIHVIQKQQASHQTQQRQGTIVVIEIRPAENLECQQQQTNQQQHRTADTPCAALREIRKQANNQNHAGGDCERDLQNRNKGQAQQKDKTERNQKQQ